jgi:hypothetical protein
MDGLCCGAAVRTLVGVALVCLELACSSGNELSGKLPGDGEVTGWRRAASPVLIDTDTALYNQIDGAAPKYIDRGWVASIYGQYLQGDSVLQVAVHDMGTPDNAQALFNFDLPISRVAISVVGDSPNAVVDMGLPTAYKAIGFASQDYVEVSIDERSDAALASVKSFISIILAR